MKNAIMLLLIPLLIISCSGQSTEKKSQEKGHQSEAITQPKADIRVTKEYDKKGNLIRYDSSYIWSYENTAGDSVFVDVDSAMSQFYPFMDNRRQFGFRQFNNDMFYNDSLFYNDFLENDYFMHRWENSMERMNKMMLEMDSIKMQFFDEFYPGLIIPDTLPD